MGAHTSERNRRRKANRREGTAQSFVGRKAPLRSAVSAAASRPSAYSCESVSFAAAINMCKSWAEQDRRMETIPRFGRCKTTRAENGTAVWLREEAFGLRGKRDRPSTGFGTEEELFFLPVGRPCGRRERATFARVGALREARIPTRGMRVHRKRGEQLLSCQREPLNLPADLLTIVPAPFRRFRLFLVPYQRGPSLLLFVASFCCSVPASFRTHRDLI